MSQPKYTDALSTPSSKPLLVAAVTYFLILLCVWGMFSTTSGLPWETYFTVYSESSPGWRGFFYSSDLMRAYNATFFHIAYLLGEATGMRGSFIPYQIVYAALWWSRSLLIFLIVRRLVPDSGVLPFSIGALALLHSSDTLVQWIGQMHQFGYFVWLLLALYMLVLAFQQTSAGRAVSYVMLACIFEQLCLWTYEGPLFIVLAAPMVFIVLFQPQSLKRVAALCAIWYAAPAVYLWLTFERYLHSGGHTYQEGLLRTTFTPGAILSDWVFNVRYSLSFWAWESVESHLYHSQVLMLTAGATLTFMVAGLWFARTENRRWIQPTPLRDKPLLQLLGAGIIFLFLSFPAHLLLAAARTPRRTQLLSSIAAAIVLGTTASILAGVMRRDRWRPVLAILFVVPIVWIGATRTLERGGALRRDWNINLQGMQQLLRAAPVVRDGTIVVMTNVPRQADPFFAYAFWFNLALRLAYPQTTIAGVYYYDDNTPAPADNLVLRGDRWEYTGEGIAPMITSSPVNQTLVIEFDQSGTAKTLLKIPEFICHDECAGDAYDPHSRIVARPPAPEALRRYGPL